MDRRKFLSRILCLGAVVVIVPKIILKIFPDRLYIFTKGNVGLSCGGSPSYKLDVNGTDRIRQYPLTPDECWPPEWATNFQWVYPALK